MIIVLLDTGGLSWTAWLQGWGWKLVRETSCNIWNLSLFAKPMESHNHIGKAGCRV